MMNSKMKCALATCVLAMTACATTATTPTDLITARASVESMQADPLAQRFDVDANRAKAELKNAERLFENRSDVSLVRHRAYLAHQYAMLVTQQADNLRAQQAISSADDRRQQLLLRARENETRQAQAAAESSSNRAKRAVALANSESERADKAARRADRAVASAAELSAELKELKAKQTERGLVFTLTDVLFDTGESILKPGADRTMRKIATYLRDSESTEIVVEGHTDSRGESSYNATLSGRRADSVRSALVSLGVESNRIESVGKGEDFPVATNGNASGRQQNRRVEIVVQSENG